MPAFQFFQHLICFWSYQACGYIIMEPRTWPIWWSSSDKNQVSSHGDIHPTIQTFISLVTMEPASLLACYSAVSEDHNYILLEDQPLSQLPDTSWYISSLPAPPIIFILSQHILLLSLPSYIFFDLPSHPCDIVHDTSQIVLNSAYVSHLSPCRWYPGTFQCLYPLPGALIGRRTLSSPYPEESPLRELISPFSSA